MENNKQNEAQALLDSRLSVYGERVKSMEDVAQVWSGILGVPVRADQVTLLMCGYKLVRASKTPDYEDNIKDVEGYALMFREIIGDDMISAVTTDEYLQQKLERDADAAVEEEIETELAKRERAYNKIEEQADAEEQQPPSLEYLSPAQKVMAQELSTPTNNTHPLELAARDYLGIPEARGVREIDQARFSDALSKLYDRKNAGLYSHRDIADLSARAADEYYGSYLQEQEKRIEKLVEDSAELRVTAQVQSRHFYVQQNERLQKENRELSERVAKLERMGQ